MNFLEIFVKQLNATNVTLMLVVIAIMFWLAFYTRRFRKQPIKIVGHKNTFFTFSGIITALCLIFIVYQIFSSGLNLSLEFTGGTMLEVGFPVGKQEKSAIPSLISDVVEQYNSEISDEKRQLKHPITQPEGSPKVVVYEKNMNKVTFTLKKPDASLSAADLKGLPATFIDRFGKVRFIEDSFVEKDGTVTFSVMLESDPELFTSIIVDVPDEEKSGVNSSEQSDSGESKKEDASEPVVNRRIVFADQNDILNLLRSFDENLEIVSVTIDPPISLVGVSDAFQAAFIRLSKKDGTSLANDEINDLLIMISKKIENKVGSIYLFKKESIGPSIGKELAQKAAIALLVALIMQLIYITVRFNNKWYYGLAADIGLLHDLIIMLGVYAILDLEFDSPFVSAMMTIIGYSVMNSIVIFDRVREDLILFKEQTFDEVVNTSCNLTMTRSVNTLLTVLITLFALYFFGGATLKNFAFALIVGCIAGAYSSVFLVPSCLSVFEARVKKEEEKKAQERRGALMEAAASKRKRREANRIADTEELPPESEHDELDDQEVSQEEDKPSKTAKPAKRTSRRAVRRKRR